MKLIRYIALILIFISVSGQTPSRRIVVGAGDPPLLADYRVFELGNKTTPTDCTSSAFDTANVLPMTGFNDTSGLNPNVKIVWQNNFASSPDRIFIRAFVTDTDAQSLSYTNDDPNWFDGGNGDYIDFRFRADTQRILDSAFKIISANLQPAYLDGDYSGAGGTRNAAVSLTTTVSRVINAGANWCIFVSIEAGVLTPNTTGIANFQIRDKDASVAAKNVFFGGTSVNAMLDLTSYRTIEFSTLGLPDGPADTTPPVVSAPVASLITSTGARVTATVNEQASCQPKWGTASKSYIFNGPVFSAVSGNCIYDLTNLDPAKTYFTAFEAADNSGNAATSSEASFTTAGTSATCTLYAGNSTAGSGNGSSLANRGLIGSLWAAAGPGSVICMNDGIYTGASSMIRPPAGKSGTSSAPITVRAINDGAVLIDGQGVNSPIRLDTNVSWFVIEGVNAANSVGTVVLIQNNSNNHVIRRVCAWNAKVDQNVDVFGINSSFNILLEDTCGFGTARKIYTNSQGGNNVTIRRSFGIWNNSTSIGPKMVFANSYNSYNAVYENNIGMINEEGGTPDQPYGIFSQDGNTTFNYLSKSKYLASMGIVRSAFVVNSGWLGQSFGSRSVDATLFKDLVLYQEGHSQLRAMTMQLFDGGSSGKASCSPGCDRRIEDITEVNFSANDSINTSSNGWTVSNKQSYGSIANAISGGASPFQTTAGNGARMCFRTIGGVLTSEKLWPWPMRDRINAALTAAGKNPNTYFGTGQNIQTYVESLWGTIPSACKS